MASERELKFVIQAENRADKAFRDVERGIDGLQGKLKQMQPAFKKMALAGTAAFAAISGAAVLSIKAATNFESSFAGVRKTVDATEEEFRQLSETMRSMARTIPIDVNELNRVGELAGQLGVGVGDIEKFTEVMAKLAVTTNLTSDQAATDFARIANVMQEPLENVDRMGALIVDLGNNFATTEAEISEFAQRIAGAGKIVGLTTADVFAIGTAMSSVGIQAEAGGTAVQKTLLEMHKASIQGGETLDAFAKTAGMSSDEFSKAFREDAMSALNSFVVGLGEMGDEAVNVFEAIGLEDVRLQRAFLSLANAGDLLTRSVETGSKAWEENSALTIEAEKRFATTASQMQLLKNNINDAAIVLGATFLPIINDIVKAVTPLIVRLSEWIEQNPTLARNIIIVVAAIAGLVAVVGMLGLVLPSIISGVGLLGAAFSLLLANPIVLAIAAIIAVIAFWVINWEKIKSGLLFVWEGLRVQAERVFNGLKDFFQSVWDSITGIFESALDKIMGTVDRVLSAIDRVKSAARSAGEGVGSFIAEPFQRTLGGGAFGIDSVPRTGAYLLHKGERVVPSGQAGMGGSIVLNITGTFLSESVAEEMGNVIIRKLRRTMKIS